MDTTKPIYKKTYSSSFNHRKILRRSTTYNLRISTNLFIEVDVSRTWNLFSRNFGVSAFNYGSFQLLIINGNFKLFLSRCCSIDVFLVKSFRKGTKGWNIGSRSNKTTSNNVFVDYQCSGFDILKYCKQ